MALKITCPHCGEIRRLQQPYPLPGTEVQCDGCGRGLAISYPPGMVDKMKLQGIRFDDPFADDQRTELRPIPAPPRAPAPAAAPAGPTPTRAAPRPPVVAPPPTPAPAAAPPGPTPTRAALPPPLAAPAPRPAPPPAPVLRPAPTEALDATTVERPGVGPTDRTEPLSSAHAGPAWADDPSRAVRAPGGPPTPPLDRGAPTLPAPPAGVRGAAPATADATRPLPAGQRPGDRPPAPPPRKRSLLGRVVRALAVLFVLGGVAGGALVAWALHHYSQGLPTVDALSTYEPPSVTVVRDRDGALLGEIYEKRRYVVPLTELPPHLVDAFIAAEDANYWTHDGVDYMGIVRAVGRNLAKGKKAQGASTITQQVARNFLLSSEKTYERKIREIILARRIEQTFDKEHILYLYLNQIYLGSGAYGVEAASRTYFGKSARDITLAEAAILAGLPQRPSDYSPHQNWDKARARQEYALGQLLAKGFIDEPTWQAAMDEVVEIAPRTNEFLAQAPYFTEHVRRYLVETYGFDKVYNDGLTVDTTCDLELQKAAQQAVVDNVLRASNSIGWNGPRETLAEADIAPRLEAQEQALRQEQSQTRLAVAAVDGGTGGYGPLPARSALVEGRVYPAVVLEVAQARAVVGIGAHRVLVPVEWSLWMYTPNPERSFKSRVQRDLTDALARGDVLEVRVEAADLATVEELASHRAAVEGQVAAGRVYQDPELEGALLSFRHSDGAVLAMVGGTDFEQSEFNRATQAMRQVGSTFKPIVYAAAIGTRHLTAGTLVQDAPTVFGVLGYGLYKPGNYGEDYLGHITLRRALQLSRNVVTVRVLDKIGLEPVFQLAGPKLRIGYDQPVCTRQHVAADSECPGTMTPSPVAGMAWCEHCDPTTCPMIRVDDPGRCLSTPESREGETWCRSCDVSLRACNWAPQRQLSSRDACLDARLDEQSGEVLCRVCDLSVGLGSSSLTMLELARAYSVFATYGHLVEPYWIERVLDRDGTVIEQHETPESFPQVLDPGVAGIAHWMLREVATGGTAARTNRLGVHVAGKTGTTNDFKDAWFVGYDPRIITATWVGFDTPRSMGVSFTGGDTALPIWMDYMAVASPKDQDQDFPPLPRVELVPIDENTGRVARGGRPIPMLPGTAPDNVVGDIGQKTAEDLLTTDF